MRSSKFPAISRNFYKFPAMFLLAVLVFSQPNPVIAQSGGQSVSATYELENFAFRVDVANKDDNIIEVALDEDFSLPIRFGLVLLEPSLASGDNRIGRDETAAGEIVRDIINVKIDLNTDATAPTNGFYMSLMKKEGNAINSFHNCGESYKGQLLTCSNTIVDSSTKNNGNPAIPNLIPNQAVETELIITRDMVKNLVLGEATIPQGGKKVELWVNPWMELSSFSSITSIVAKDPVFTGDSKWIVIRAFESQDDLEKALPLPDDQNPPAGPGTSTNRAQGLYNNLGTGIVILINTILGVIFAVFRWIAWTLGTLIFVPLLEITLNIQAADMAGGIILAGWTFVRDVVNMFFILFLIIIGLGTILKIESYNYKKLLVNLIMMAFLVNFSLVIGRIVIQFADTIQFSFLPTVAASGSETDGISGVKYLFNSLITFHLGSFIDGLTTASDSFGGAAGATFTIIFQTILDLGVVVTFAALAIFMLIRTVALWILLILSPLAYALMILPMTSGMAKQWWTNFIKYAFFAPILAFFLRLTLVLYQNGLQIVPESMRDTLGLAGVDVANESVIDFLNDATARGGASFENALVLGMIYSVIIAFLWAGLVVTQKMGIAGAGAIVGLAQKGIASPFALTGKGAKWVGGRGAGYLGGKWDEWTSKLIKGDQTTRANKVAFALLNPVRFAQGWDKRAKDRREERKTLAQGAGEETASWIQTFGKEKIPQKELARRRLVNKRAAELREAMGDDIDKADVRDFFGRVQEIGGIEGEFARAAFQKVAAGQGYGDDWTEVTATDKWSKKLKLGRYQFSDAQIAEKMKTDGGRQELEALDFEERFKFNDQMYQLHLWAAMGLDPNMLRRARTERGFMDSDEYKKWEALPGNQEKLKDMSDLTPLNKKTGHFEQMYTSVRDENLGRFRGVIDENFEDGAAERTEMINGEVVKIPIRDQMRIKAWHNDIPKMADYEYNPDGTATIKGWRPGDVVDKDGKSLMSTYQVGQFKNMGPEHESQATHVPPRTLKYTVGQWVKGVDKDSKQIVYMGDTPEEREWNKKQFTAYLKKNPEVVRAYMSVKLTGKADGIKVSDVKWPDGVSFIQKEKVVREEAPASAGSPGAAGKAERGHRRSAEDIASGVGGISQDNVERIITELERMNKGAVTASEIGGEMARALGDQAKGQKVAEKIVEKTASSMVDSAPQDVFTMEGMDAAKLKRAVSAGIVEGLKSQNAKVGSPQVTESVVAKIKEIKPDIDDGLAREIAAEVNKQR